MKTAVKAVDEQGSKRMTLSFIGKSLKRMGLDAKRDGSAYYVDFGHVGDMVIGFRSGSISVAMVMPTDWDSIENQLFSASLTMAKTNLTKVFLLPEGDEINIWFSAEGICKTCGEFEELFDVLFKQLNKSVRIFVGIRDNIAEAMQVQSLAEFVASQAVSQQPS